MFHMKQAPAAYAELAGEPFDMFLREWPEMNRMVISRL